MRTLLDRMGSGRVDGKWDDVTGEHAKNSTGAGAADGTALIAEWINEYLYHPLQKLFRLAGMTPNHQTDTIDNSQIIQALMSAGFNNGKKITFEQSEEKSNINTGEDLSTIMGKLKKFYDEVFNTYSLGTTLPITNNSTQAASTEFVQNMRQDMFSFPKLPIKSTVDETPTEWVDIYIKR